MLFTLCVSLYMFGGHTAQAQSGSSQLSELARKLADQANTLADKTEFDYKGSTNNRSTTETLFLTHQFSASANLFRQMVSDNRSPDELRDAAKMLDNIGRDLARNFDSSRFFFARGYFTESQKTLNDLVSQINNGDSFRNDDNNNDRRRIDDSNRRRIDDVDPTRITGKMYWKGRVDDNVQLLVRDGEVTLRLISGTPYDNATYKFTSPLPRRRLTVNLNVIKGRGEVKILQQPARENDFTTVIEIRDPKGGASDYELELTW
ncbi:MAG: hypothetical protein NVSMB56_14990 [Pyrinomonadaceae bacterium]